MIAASRLGRGKDSPVEIDGAALFAGKYRIVGEIGRGGMGAVFRAEDVSLKRNVALKFLAADLSSDAESRARFLREAQTAAALDNPHVCTVYEVGESEGRAFIAMAFIEGQSLKDRIAAGPLPLPQVLDLARQIADGLADAHAKGIVHRDIKPANIMLAGNRVAKITDFGLARVQDPGDSTRTASVMGTLAYMSPEQAQGLRTDARSDIWSLGCVIYEMLAGQRPFASGQGQTDLYAILHGSARPVSVFRPDVPARLAAIVERCLEKDLRRRYPDAAGVLEDLKSVRQDAASIASAAARKETPSIAVLPFADMSPEKNQDYFAEGIAEELIHALARIKGLRVVARTSAFALAGKKLDVPEIGRILNVGAVLEGSVRQSGSRLRVTAQLISVADGFHLWSERFDRDAGDIFAIQDELSEAIVEHLKVSLHLDEKSALQARSTTHPEAYNTYLKGRYFLARPQPDTLQKALHFFEQSVALDPQFAPGYAGIASVHAFVANMNFAPPAEVYPKAKAAIEKALALDDHLPEAHATAAMIAFWYDWDWTAAEASFNRLLALNPGDAFTRGAYAWFLLTSRRFEECVHEIDVAVSLDPLMPLLYGWLVGLNAAAGRLDRALEAFSRAVEIDPAFGLPYFHAGIAYYRKGQIDKAIETLEQSRKLVIYPGWAEGMLVFAYRRRGDHASAERLFAEMIEQKKQIPVSSVTIAWCCANEGNLDAAFEWFERAIEERDTLIPFLHVYGPAWVPLLAGDPRYWKLLARLGLAEFAR
jgi:serine/threonine protein kinase/Tfp pilus assembly protein PilF